MKNTIQILTIGTIAAAIAGASLVSSVHADTNNTTSEAQTSYEMTNFQTEQSEIIAEMKLEVADYVTDNSVKTQAETILATLGKTTDDQAFFAKLETLYTLLDSYYEKNDITFEGDDFEGFDDDMDMDFDMNEDKAEVLSILKEEISFVEDDTVNSQLTKALSDLETVTDEATFTQQLDSLLEKFDAHYDAFEENEADTQGDETEIDNLTQEDLEMFEADFSLSKKDIVSHLQEEITQYVADTTVKTEAQQALSTLENTTDEDVFFEKLSTTYDMLDSYYEKNDIEVNFVD